MTTSTTTVATPTRKRQVWGVVGYRHFTDRAAFDHEMALLVDERGWPDAVSSGGATGTDTMAHEWSDENEIEFLEHLPKENTARELLARNTLIVDDSTLVVAFVSTKSRGTHDTINKAIKKGIPIIKIQID
jgi:hypothetical protein